VSTTAWRALSSSVRSAVTAASVPGNSMPTTSAPIAVSATDSARPSPPATRTAVPAGERIISRSSWCSASFEYSACGASAVWGRLEGLMALTARSGDSLCPLDDRLPERSFLPGRHPAFLPASWYTAHRWPLRARRHRLSDRPGRPRVRRFLLRTSALEGVSGELADILTGGSGRERICRTSGRPVRSWSPSTRAAV
jgi:hypothetical protein